MTISAFGLLLYAGALTILGGSWPRPNSPGSWACCAWWPRQYRRDRRPAGGNPDPAPGAETHQPDRRGPADFGGAGAARYL